MLNFALRFCGGIAYLQFPSARRSASIQNMRVKIEERGSAYQAYRTIVCTRRFLSFRGVGLWHHATLFRILDVRTSYSLQGFWLRTAGSLTPFAI